MNDKRDENMSLDVKKSHHMKFLATEDPGNNKRPRLPTYKAVGSDLSQSHIS